MSEYTGGSVSYYTVHIANPTTPGRTPYDAECNDIIEALGMNYAEGNAFKAIWRSCAARTLGKAKAGYRDGVYDAEKVEFFGRRMVLQQKAAAGAQQAEDASMDKSEIAAPLQRIIDDTPTDPFMLAGSVWVRNPQFHWSAVDPNGKLKLFRKKPSVVHGLGGPRWCSSGEVPPVFDKLDADSAKRWESSLRQRPAHPRAETKTNGQ